MQSNVEIVPLVYEQGSAVFLDMRRGIAFGPVMENTAEARAFLSYLSERFPYVNISTINTERLLIYYKEFLAHESPTVGS